MNLNEFKRKYFFVIDKLQISRTERIAFALIFAILVALFLGSAFIKKKYNFSQEKYDQILAEFERKSALIEQQKQEVEKRFLPPAVPENEMIAEAEIETEVPVEQVSSTENINSEPENAPEETAAGAKININTAGAEDLKKLKGIGDATAAKIIEYRNRNGAFKTAQDLLKVKGIGPKRLQDIEPYIVF